MEWKKFRKKPVVVEAVQWDPLTMRWQDFPEECYSEPSWGIIGTDDEMDMLIVTLEGGMTAHPGDWVVKGIVGEFYPVRDDIFRATYEEVE